MIGGVSGFMTAAVPVDWQLTDTYFVVAHLHYVLIGINVFPVVGGIYYWFPKFTGRLLNERLGKWNFWIMFIGFNVGFFPMHIARAARHAAPHLHLSGRHGLGRAQPGHHRSAPSCSRSACCSSSSTSGAACATARAPAPIPWDAPTLEWATPSPPPPYNFAVIPTVASRHPLWESRMTGQTGERTTAEGFLLDDGRETIGTTRARRRARRDPAHAGRLAGAAAAVARARGRLRRHADALVVALRRRAWRRRCWRRSSGSGPKPVSGRPWTSPMSEADALYRGEPLPVGSKGRLSSGWWGMVTLIATETALFAYLLFSYFYVASQNGGAWPPGGPPKLDLAIPGTIVLMLGSVTMWWGEKGIRAGRQRQLLLGLGASVLLGLAFVALEGIEWSHKGFTPRTERLRLALLHRHRLSPHARAGRRADADHAVRLDAARLLRRAPPLDGLDRRDVLALRHRGLGRRLPDLLRLALSRPMNATTASRHGSAAGAPAASFAASRIGYAAGRSGSGCSARPIAWSLQELVNVSLAGHACYPHDVPLATPLWPHLGGIVGLRSKPSPSSSASLPAWSRWRNWRRSRHEKPGDAHQLLGSGDGRTRFMAMAGMS